MNLKGKEREMGSKGKRTGVISAGGLMVAVGETEAKKAMEKLVQRGMVIVPEKMERQFLEQCQGHGLKVENVATSERKGGDCTLYADGAQTDALKAGACAVMLTVYGNVTLGEELCGLMERTLDNCGVDVAYKVTDAVDGTMLRCERGKARG